jgi:hypothetical protein
MMKKFAPALVAECRGGVFLAGVGPVGTLASLDEVGNHPLGIADGTSDFRELRRQSQPPATLKRFHAPTEPFGNFSFREEAVDYFCGGASATAERAVGTVEILAATHRCSPNCDGQRQYALQSCRHEVSREEWRKSCAGLFGKRSSNSAH